MLLEFKVENYKSIKDLQVFSMLRSSREKSLVENYSTIKLNKIGESQKEIDVLKTSAIYGANASGKSNLIGAMFIVQWMVVNSHRNQQGDLLPVEPFRLDKLYLNKPSCFEFLFIENGIKYEYILKTTQRAIEEENLYFYPNGRKQKVFLRNGNKIEINFGSSSSEEGDILRQKIYAEDISDNILFLSLANRIKSDTLKSAFNWFSKKLVVISAQQQILSTTTPMIKDNLISENIVLKYLQVADPIIAKMRVDLEERPIDDPLFSNINKHILSQIALNNGQTDITGINKNATYTILKEKFFRYGKNEHGELEPVEFTMMDESTGTRKFYSLIGHLILALKNGNVLICDELGNSLHPLIMQNIIELFTSEQNQSNAQLVISTHNVSFLDTPNLFRKDQIWMTDKEISGETNLYSVSDFSDTKRDDLTAKSYLKGIFGGIPNSNVWEFLDD